MIKFAEVSSTPAAPATASPDPNKPPSFTVRKQGSVGHLVPGHARNASIYDPEEGPPYHDYIHGKNQESLPQGRVLHPHVDVSDAKPPTKIQEKKASRYALNGQYPLDQYDHVKMASAYFDEWWKKMPWEDRHEYAVNLCKRASELGIQTSETAQKYGAESLASVEEIKIAFDARRMVLTEPKVAQVLGELEELVLGIKTSGEEKIATVVEGGTIDRRALLAQVLSEFDKMAGISHLYDSDIADPCFSLYGVEKVAAFSETIGNQTVTADDLEYIGANRIHLVRGTFGDDMATEFKKDPVGIYKSLPVSSRKVLANLAKSQNTHDPVI